MAEHRFSSPEEQAQAPYSSALLLQAEALKLRLQAPGHGGQLPLTYPDHLRGLAPYDLSVVRGLDVADGRTQSPLSQAHALAAAAVGAADCFFFTCGASSAARAMVACVDEMAAGRIIVVSGNVHVSVVNELHARKARVRVIDAETHPLGMATTIAVKDLDTAMKAGDVGGVILSAPSYEGLFGDVRGLVRIAQNAGIVVGVDESWAPEAPFSQGLIESAVQLGADLVVGSTHKGLRALGQGAWMWRPQRSRVPAALFRRRCLAQRTTSKSSIILDSLDRARVEAYFGAPAGIRENNRAVDRARELLPPGLIVDWPAERTAGRTIAERSMKYRITVNTARLGYTGFEVAAKLAARGVQVAQPNIRYLFFGTGVGQGRLLQAAFAELGEVVSGLDRRPSLGEEMLPPPSARRIRDVDLADARGATTVLPAGEAIGKAIAHPFGMYPPGTTMLWPGMVVTPEDVVAIHKALRVGATAWGGDPEAKRPDLIEVYV